MYKKHLLQNQTKRTLKNSYRKDKSHDSQDERKQPLQNMKTNTLACLIHFAKNLKALKIAKWKKTQLETTTSKKEQPFPTIINFKNNMECLCKYNTYMSNQTFIKHICFVCDQSKPVNQINLYIIGRVQMKFVHMVKLLKLELYNHIDDGIVP